MAIPAIPASEFVALIEELTRKSLMKNCDRAMAGPGKSQAFGIIRRWSYRPHLSRNTWMRPHLWKLLLEFADKHVAIAWDGVQVNDNYTSAPHKDKGNEGDSYTVSFGDFTGGELCLDTGTQEGIVQINTRLRGYLFNGSAVRHWTAPHIGRRFCLVFYKIVWPTKFLPRYRVTCREVAEGLEITDEYDDSIVVLDTRGHVKETLRSPRPVPWLGRLTQRGQKSRMPLVEAAPVQTPSPHTPALPAASSPDLPFGF